MRTQRRAPGHTASVIAGFAVLCLVALPASSQQGDPLYPWNYSGIRERPARLPRVAGACQSTTPAERVLIAGDSWAQFMWDDDTHNLILDRFGHADKLAISRSLGENPGPGHTGPEYAVAGSEARDWVDTANFPWIANVVAELGGLPTIDTVMLSIGGNDILAGKPDGGWYKDMDLDVPGSEEALFDRILADTDTIAQAFTSVQPGLEVLISSYEYPNFNVDPPWCRIYACPKRRELSRDPINDLVTDQELNAMIIDVEARHIAWTNTEADVAFDHGVGEMHHYYGDGVAAPGELPRPGQLPPDYLPFPGGDPLSPTLRENFRTFLGIPADPIHLDEEAYEYKVAVQAETHLFPHFRGPVTTTFLSQGGANDGWTNGVSFGTDAITVGDDGARLFHGITSFDTSTLPDAAQITAASLYLLQDTRTGDNPLTSGILGAPGLDIATGSFGAPEVEASDDMASADATDVGCFVGSAEVEYHALRIELTAEGLAAINRVGLTQFRLAFSAVDAGVDSIDFKDGDSPVASKAVTRRQLVFVDELQPDGSVETRLEFGTALEHRGLVEVLGSARPFLDVSYAPPIFSDGFESGDTSAWTATVP